MSYSQIIMVPVPYFFGHKTDPFYKMDLDLWDCLGRVKLIFYQNFMTDSVIFSHSREGKPHLIAE